MKLGNLDNMSIGMGLVAKPGQTVPSKYARFEGLGEGTLQNISPILVIVGILLLARLV